MQSTNEKSANHGKIIYGISMMLLHAFCMSVVVITSKQLTQSLHPNQVAFLYKAAILFAIIPWCFVGGIKKNLRTKKLGLHAARGAFSISASLCFLSALSKINALDVTALTYLEQILIMIIGVVYFKEKFTNTKLTLVLLSFIGAMFIARPSILTHGVMPSFNMDYTNIFLALIFWAMNNTAIKVLGKTEHTKAQLFYMLLISSMFSLPLAMQEWRPLETWHIKYLVILAISHLLHSVAFFKALKHGEMSTVMPFDYTRLLFTGIMSYLFLNEIPNSYSIIGYCLMVLGGMIFIRYEALSYRLKSKKAKEEKLQELGSEYEQI